MMELPRHILEGIHRLEAAGFEAYAVGGCVRDALLGLQPQDYDLCTSAAPRQIRQVFADCRQVLAGETHGTVTVLLDGQPVEITAFRTEGDYRDHRHPAWVDFVQSLEPDLARRDFTINAMAYSPRRGLQDPFGGREDLKNRCLRAVGEPDRRFSEDALRILRGVRFAVRYGLQVDPATEGAMLRLAPLMDSLARERVFEELCKLLPWITAQELLRYSPIITQVLPELAPTVGFQQRNPHHLYDVYTHTAHVVQSVPPELALRWAALLHDAGKPETFTVDEAGHGHFLGHAQASARLAGQALLRLKAPTALRQQVVELIEQHMTWLPLDKKVLRRRLSRLGQENLTKLLRLQAADTGGKGVDDQQSYFQALEALLQELLQEQNCLSVGDLAVDGHDLMALGFQGKAIGQAMKQLLEQVLEEALPNEKQALLQYMEEQR